MLEVVPDYSYKDEGEQARKGGKGESEDTFQKALQIELVSLRSSGKPPFVIPLRATMAREPWHVFYLRNKRQCFIQVLLELEHLNDTGSLPFQVVTSELWWLKETKDL